MVTGTSSVAQPAPVTAANMTSERSVDTAVTPARRASDNRRVSYRFHFQLLLDKSFFCLLRNLLIFSTQCLNIILQMFGIVNKIFMSTMSINYS